jgi:N utilization substance protein A
VHQKRVLVILQPLLQISEKLAEQLGVDSEVAGVLIDEGFASIDDIADADAANPL